MTNDFWREHHADMVAQIEDLSLNRAWSHKEKGTSSQLFDEAMSPYLSDPFRGCKNRFWLGENEDPIELEANAAKEAVARAGLSLADIDYVIAGSFFSAHIDIGNAAYIAKHLGLSCPVMNLEAACSASLLGIELALALVESGRARRVLLIGSCFYSLRAPSDEPVSIANGDGICAMVVGPANEPFFLGSHTVNTRDTCGALTIDLTSVREKPALRMRLAPAGGRLIRQAAEKFLPECVHGVLQKTGLALQDIDFFAFNAATAWMIPFAVRSLGIDPNRTLNTHSTFANTGPALVPTSLFYGAHAGLIPEGGLVLAYGIGNTSNASAMVFRWKDVKLAPIQIPLVRDAESETASEKGCEKRSQKLG
jgi:3-oxoacyl-[acyl-carrier-protein] synthase-3